MCSNFRRRGYKAKRRAVTKKINEDSENSVRKEVRTMGPDPIRTTNIGSPDHLTQVQEFGDRVEIVDHFDHGLKPVDLHLIHTVGADGSIDSELK
jgi:hypothetical protein